MGKPTIDLDTTGIQVTVEALMQFGTSEFKKAARKVMRLVAKEILVVAKQYAPVEYGTLENSLTVRAAKLRKRSGDVGASVQTREGMFAGETFYGGFQEFGWTAGGKYHEGSPFLRPALYDHRNRWRVRSVFYAKQEYPKAVVAARAKAKTKKGKR